MNKNSYINEHGVLIGGYETVIASGRHYHIVIEIAQHPETGKWAYGIDLWVGPTAAVDSFGHGFAPSAKEANYTTKEEAESHAIDTVKKKLQHGLEWCCSNGRQGNPAVIRAIKEAMTEISNRNQLCLFESL